MVELTLRPLSNEEYAHYYEFAVKLLADEEAKAYNDDPLERYRSSARAFEKLIPKGDLESSAQYLLAIEHDRIVIGIVWYELLGDHATAYIRDLFIYEEFRRHGYARATLEKLERILRQTGIRRIILNVFNHNKTAKKLYRSMGYSRSLIQMVKKLGGM
ncbi:GNAT family N-acetyltransferase [Sinorhizobium meliloti]|jgi:ribosomal protein S18 acetylase RimI-like enzyme|uniref:GNAT family N-acetyltransferase n=1 Tax=Rhizobium meliloti TaxID=382 RepID=UPI0020BD4850|nr:GNAT family N-acetyltransferase [Sinorhizobium meliloti]